MKRNLLKLASVAALAMAMAGCGVQANTALATKTVDTDAASSTTITSQQAKEAALAHAGVFEDDVTSMRVYEDKEDGRDVYDVEFATASTRYDYEVDSHTGEILTHEQEMIKQADTAKNDSAKTPATTNGQTNGSTDRSTSQNKTPSTAAPTSITKVQAQTIALQDAGVSASSAQVIRVKEDYENGRAVYEVEFYSGNTEYDYEIAKADGTILAKDYDIENWAPTKGTDAEQAQGAITLEEAKAIALSKVNGAGNNDIHIKQDRDDGLLIYEGEIVYQGMEYEFEINAANGAIIEWSSEHYDWD